MKPFFDQKKKGRYRRPGAAIGEAQPPRSHKTTKREVSKRSCEEGVFGHFIRQFYMIYMY